MTKTHWLNHAETPPGGYDREPQYQSMIAEKDVLVPMRDGVKLAIDVYRPNSDERFPALLAFAIYNKDLQGPDAAETLPPQPSWAPMWAGLLEAGDTKFFVSRGSGNPKAAARANGTATI
jgi:predicted acyl esterase